MTDLQPLVALLNRFPEAVEARASARFRVRLNPTDIKLEGDALASHVAGADGLLVSPVNRFDAALIRSLPDTVRIMATFSVGLDHIDLDAARARGIVVTNTPNVLTDATADIAMLLMLGAARRAYEGERLVRTNRWTSWRPTQLLGTDLTGKRLGILGMGRIGSAVARRAQAFGMRVHYHNRRPLPPSQAAQADYVESLDDFLARSDVLSIHCPATPATTGLIDAAAVARLPHGAIIVNTARGPIVDDDALIAGLRSGHLAAAGLDVFTGEPDIDPRYRELDRTFLLPHLGSATVETRNAMGFKALDNLEVYFAGQEPPDRAD